MKIVINIYLIYLEYTIELIKKNKNDNINDLIFQIKNINNDKNEFIINKIIF